MVSLPLKLVYEKVNWHRGEGVQTSEQNIEALDGESKEYCW